LSCAYCHNKQLIPATPIDHYYWKDEADVFNFLTERKGKLEGLVLTGGEPLMHGMQAIDFLEQVKKLGYRVKLDTNGTWDATLEWVLREGLVDYVALDIKAPWDKYDKITKVNVYTVDRIRASLDILSRGVTPFEVRTTFYEKLLTEEDLEVIERYLPAGILHRINDCKINNTVSD
jgi:pyruvate formate lyase activating enzyme